jgi:hypothetical protein
MSSSISKNIQPQVRDFVQFWNKNFCIKDIVEVLEIETGEDARSALQEYLNELIAEGIVKAVGNGYYVKGKGVGTCGDVPYNVLKRSFLQEKAKRCKGLGKQYGFKRLGALEKADPLKIAKALKEANVLITKLDRKINVLQQQKCRLRAFTKKLEVLCKKQ